MASKTTAFANAVLNHFFLNAALANVGNAAGLQPSGVAGDFYISLHTGAGPGLAGDQTTNEAAYTNYVRVAVPRNGANWQVVANVASNLLAVTFPQSASGPETETYVGVGSDASPGVGNLFFFAVLTAPLVVNNLITPEFLVGQLTFTET